MRLLLVELSRFRSRRAIVLMLLGATLLVGFLAGGTIWETRPISAADRAAAQQMAEREAQQPYIQEELENCRENPEMYLGEDSPEACEEAIVPRAEWFLHRSALSLNDASRDAGTAAVLILGAVLIVAGTTFAGADWASGSMSNQLLFQPRRWKVWSAKAGAVLVSGIVVAAVLLVAFWAALYLTMDLRGMTPRPRVVDAVTWMTVRAVGLVALAGLGGYALTMLLRHTVGSLALMFGYAVGGAALIAALPVARAGRWELSNNVFAWLYDGHEYYDPTVECTNMSCDQTVRMTLDQGAGYLGVLVAVILVLSVFFFRRRDIP